MKLIPKDPFFKYLPHFDDLNRFFNVEMDDDMGFVSNNWTPLVDVIESDDHFLIKADVPGVEPKDIEIALENGVLTLKGEREDETTKEENGYTRVERSHGSFYRRLPLPDTADPDNVSAKSEQGVLEITVNKREHAKPRKITIDVQ